MKGAARGTALSKPQRNKIINMYWRNRQLKGMKKTKNIKRISRRLKHSVVTVRKYVNIHLKTRDILTWREQSGLVFMGGRPASYNHRVERLVKRIIATHCELYLDVIQRVMLKITGLIWSISTINRIVRKFTVI